MAMSRAGGGDDYTQVQDLALLVGLHEVSASPFLQPVQDLETEVNWCFAR